MNIFIVDDQPTDLKLLRAQLEAEGHVVFEAHDGVDALALLERQRMDAVISDILMPRMDGYRLCHEIRKHTRLRDLPVIIYTATYTSPGDEKLAFDMGANKYLKKPVSVEILVAALHEVIAQPHAAPRANALREMVVLKEYNERLVSKLLKKNTELHAQTEALRASERKFQSVFEQAAAGVIIDKGPWGQFVNVNRRFCEMVGYSAEELLQLTAHDITHPDDIATDIDQREQINFGIIREFYREKRYRRKDGSFVWAKTFVAPLDPSEAKPTLRIGVIIDITERKRAEEVLTFLASTSTGRPDEPFFNTLARYLAQSLGMDFVCIDRLEGEGLNARTVAVWCDGRFEDNVTYALKDTPCGDVVGKQVCCFPASVSQFFPRDQALKDLRAESYVGVTLWSHAGQPIGLIAVIGRTPLANRSLAEATLKMVAVRAASELERMDHMETLRASEERFRTLVETAPDAIFIQTNHRFAYVNAAALRFFGATRPEELLGQPVLDRFHPDFRMSVSERIRSLNEDRQPVASMDEVCLTLAGSPKDVNISAVPFAYQNQNGALVFARDITERKRAEATLRQSEEHFRSLFESMLHGYAYCRMIFVGDRAEDFTYLSVNRAFETLIGLKDVEGKNVSTVIPGLRDSDPELLEAFGRVARTGVPERFENYVKTLDMWFSISVYSPQTEHFVAVFDVITDRKQAEQTLRASEERYRTLAETAQDIIYVIDREFRVTYINEYGVRQFGRLLPEVIGRHLTELFPPETTQWQLADMADVFRTGESLYQERQLSTGPRLMWLDSRLVPIKKATGEVESILGISRDITEHKQVEGQRLRMQRLESIGTLAGGVAHDLNNALAPILMATELLRLGFPNMAGTYLDLIQASAQRGAAMVKQLLTFAKGVEGERLIIQPKHLLKEMEKLIGSTFPKNIQLKTRYGKDLRTILGDATQLHQVLLNLCINARDAMPEGGTLTLEAENMELDTIYADALMEAKPGHYVVWRVMDTGTGIPPEILNRIFDPFFTTKGPGKGTGLGLSTLVGIVKSHSGFVRVYSVPGKGSTFAVYLPAAASSADNTPLPTETDMPYRGHGETILVVDDETAMRTVLRAMLTKLNFKVLTASDGAAALTQVTEQAAELRAVITDVHMPQMDGLSFVRVLKGRLPQVGIIVASGRLDEPDENEFKKLGVSALLGKPFSLKELVEALKTVFQK